MGGAAGRFPPPARRLRRGDLVSTRPLRRCRFRADAERRRAERHPALVALLQGCGERPALVALRLPGRLPQRRPAAGRRRGRQQRQAAGPEHRSSSPGLVPARRGTRRLRRFERNAAHRQDRQRRRRRLGAGLAGDREPGMGSRRLDAAGILRELAAAEKADDAQAGREARCRRAARDSTAGACHRPRRGPLPRRRCRRRPAHPALRRAAPQPGGPGRRPRRRSPSTPQHPGAAGAARLVARRIAPADLLARCRPVALHPHPRTRTRPRDRRNLRTVRARPPPLRLPANTRLVLPADGRG
jgi:hypothetical protein